MTWKTIVLYLTILLVSEAALSSATSMGAVADLLALGGIGAFMYVHSHDTSKPVADGVGAWSRRGGNRRLARPEGSRTSAPLRVSA